MLLRSVAASMIVARTVVVYVCWLYLSLIKTFTGQMPPDPYEPQHCQPHGNYFNRHRIMGTLSLI